MRIRDKQVISGLVVLLMLGLGLTVLANLVELTLQQKAFHVFNRLGYGPRPGEMATIQKIGIEHYIDQQLNPQSLAYPADLRQSLDKLPTRKLSTSQLYQQYGPPLRKLAKEIKVKNGTAQDAQASGNDIGSGPESAVNDSGMAKNKKNKTAMQNPEDAAELKEIQQKLRLVLLESSQARLLRASQSPRQLEESLTDFWFNHFNVFAGKGPVSVWVGHYEDHAIRPHVMGRFRDLLEATAKHPAMQFYLDNWLNTAPNSQGARGKRNGLNENYARELMELHTLGVDGGYTQQDVTELARVLTGWGIDQGAGMGIVMGGGKKAALQQGFRNGHKGFLPPALNPSASLRPTAEGKDGVTFNPRRHDFGDKVILGHTIKGTGQGELDTVLDILAKHPATAKHISYQLAQYFVSDNPPQALVDRMAKQYIASDGNIKTVLAALFKSPEFWSANAYQSKFKSPYQYFISTMRATGRVSGVSGVDKPLYVLSQLKSAGMPLYGCQPPTGYKNTTDAWLSPDAMTQRTNWATAFASGRLPLTTQTSLTTQALMDTLGVPLSPAVQQAVDKAPLKLQSALILGSPDFLKY